MRLYVYDVLYLCHECVQSGDNAVALFMYLILDVVSKHVIATFCPLLMSRDIINNNNFIHLKFSISPTYSESVN